MQVTEVRIKLMEGSEDRLRAFCSVTLDHCFVVRDLKVIDGANGPFVAMPSRKLSGHCPKCHYKNHLRAGYCNQCGGKLKPLVGSDSPQKLYADVAHPVNSECREMISGAVLAEFQAELARASEPGYRSRYDDDFEAIAESSDDSYPAEIATAGWTPDTDRPAADRPASSQTGPPQSPAAEPPRGAPSDRSPASADQSTIGTRIDPPHRSVTADHGSGSRPADARPREPQQLDSAQPDAESAAQRKRNDGGFGAGIF